MFPKKGNKLHRPGHGRGTGVSFSREIASALQSELGSTHQAVKTVMRWTGTSERTVKHWLAGTHGPSGHHLVQLIRNSDEVLKALLQLAGRRGDLPGYRVNEIRSHLTAALDCLKPQK